MLCISRAFVEEVAFEKLRDNKLTMNPSQGLLTLLSLYLLSLSSSLDVNDEKTCNPSSSRLSVLFLHSMFPSHYYPLISLGAELVSRGHKVTSFGVTIEGFEHIPNLIRSYGIDYIEGIKLKRDVYDAYIRHTQGTNITGNAFSIVSDIRKGIFQEREYLSRMVKAIQVKLNSSHYDYIIGEHATMALIYHVHKIWKTDNIMLVMLIVGLIPQYIIPWPYPKPFTPMTDNMSFLDRFINTVLYGPMEYIAIRLFMKALIPEGEESLSEPRLHLIYQPVLLTTVIGFERPVPSLPTQHYIGPMLLPYQSPLDFKIVSWLGEESESPVIYISTGTLTGMTQDMADIILSLSDQYRLLWSKPGHDHDDTNTDSVYITSWLEQTSLLKHPSVQLALLHCGVNSVHEALYFAVPVLCIPQGGDQFDIGFRLTSQKLGISITAKELTVEKLKKSVEALMTKSIYRKNVERTSRLLQEGGGAKRGADLVELYAEVGYSHTMPPFIRGEWSSIKYYNIDVWVVILSMIVLLFCGCSKYCCHCC